MRHIIVRSARARVCVRLAPARAMTATTIERGYTRNINQDRRARR